MSRENLGTGASLVAAASLMIDYTLTVSVSIAAGVAAITSAATFLQGYEVQLCLVLLALIAIANLRGVRESGRLFAPPTYTYIVMMTLLVVVGLIGVATGDARPTPRRPQGVAALHRRSRGAHRSFHLLAAPRVLVRRGRVERGRGDLERHPGVPETGVPQRRDHA